ncbi:MAG TPA: hypothetical protein VF885_17315 [Arthrobacter sp.]
MTQVTAKKSGLTGNVLGVDFKDGKAETDAPAALAFFKVSPDYTVGEPAKEDAKPADAKPAEPKK